MTPTPAYDAVSDEELDGLAAERLLDVTKETDPWLIYQDDGEFICNMDEWNPTHPDSNQAERYLLKALKDKECFYEIYDSWMECFEIKIFTRDVELQPVLSAKAMTTDPDKVNRTKTIACLMANDELEKSNE